MSRQILTDGVYDTCPTYGPQVYMPMRQVWVRDGVVEFVDKEHCQYTYSVSSFFDVNNIYIKETKQTSRVVKDLETNDYVYFIE